MITGIFIIDTNVLVAGLITGERSSPTARDLDAMLSGTLFYLLSPELLREYRDVLLRPRLSRIHGLNDIEIEQLLSEIAANAIWREVCRIKTIPLPTPGMPTFGPFRHQSQPQF